MVYISYKKRDGIRHTQKECSAMVWSVLLLRPYLEGLRCTIRKNHKWFWWILNLTNASTWLVRWRFRLKEFNFDVVHWGSDKHQGSGELTRLPTDGITKTQLEEGHPVMAIDVVDRGGCGCPSHILISISSTVVHLNSEQMELGAPTLKYFIKAQGEYPSCKQVGKRISQSKTEFPLSNYCVIIWRARWTEHYKSWYRRHCKNEIWILCINRL